MLKGYLRLARICGEIHQVRCLHERDPQHYLCFRGCLGRNDQRDFWVRIFESCRIPFMSCNCLLTLAKRALSSSKLSLSSESGPISGPYDSKNRSVPDREQTEPSLRSLKACLWHRRFSCSGCAYFPLVHRRLAAFASSDPGVLRVGFSTGPFLCRCSTLTHSAPSLDKRK